MNKALAGSGDIATLERYIHSYSETRSKTLELCAPLEIEDFVVQPWEDISPIKWHLAHTTWFFENFVLKPYDKGYVEFSPHYGKLFNSYYKSVGEHWDKKKRGELSRPGLSKILSYRKRVDQRMERLLRSFSIRSHQGDCSYMEIIKLIEIGIHHEQQHQELMLMDIKGILFQDPEYGVYAKYSPFNTRVSDGVEAWISITGGIESFGKCDENCDGSFAYDNEKPRHQRLVEPSLVRSKLVTNKEFLEFIDDGGYRNPSLWLSLGWDWVRREGVKHPLYWIENQEGFEEFTLYGKMELEPNFPVHHISFFEADAFAKWKGMRLPTEFELESVCRSLKEDWGPEGFHCVETNKPVYGLWCWSEDQYRPYPGYQNYQGSLGEYNCKFMCNQFVLRGGCFATPKGHFRPTYRNFYEPWQRWMFSGLRLAKSFS